MTEYDVRATEFLAKTGTKMTISRTGECKGFPGESDVLWRYKYQVTLSRKGEQYRFTFYDSHENWRLSKRPSRYSVLASLEMYPVPDNVEDFAYEFGYNLEIEDGRKRAENIRQACEKQYERLLCLWGEDLLREARSIFW